MAAEQQQQQQQRDEGGAQEGGAQLKGRPALPLDPRALQRGLLAGMDDFQRERAAQEAADSASRRTYEEVRLEEEQSKLDVQEAAQEVEFLKQGANAAFKRSASLGEGSAAREEAIEEALTGWGEALDACMRAPLAATATANRLAETLRCNRAAALLKIDRFADARRECELALGVNPDCVKALYRGAEALYELGGYSKAITMLERALRHEPNSFDIRRLMDDCEDALEDEGGDTLVEDAASATAANGNGGGATANGDAVGLSEEDAACVAFAESVMTAAAEAWGDSGGEHAEEITSRHVTEDGEQSGKFKVEDAFKSEVLLEECTGWIRQQAVLASADALVLTVAKRKVSFPLVWWAGDWPDEVDLEGDGLIVELETRRGLRRTWFMPVDAGKGSPTMGELLEAIELPTNCRLLTRGLLPASS